MPRRRALLFAGDLSEDRRHGARSARASVTVAFFAPIVGAIIILLATPSWALDEVSLQLKWKHQFQFAGYYMALEKGFYRDAGLDVEIREGGPGIDRGSSPCCSRIWKVSRRTPNS